MEPTQRSLFERFQSKFTILPSGCWRWDAAKGPRGYGRFRVGDKMCQAHRVSYELHNGPIPDGLVIDHLCFYPPCVNPAHLRPLSRPENTAYENVSLSRATTCTKGIHPKPVGQRGMCEECRAEWRRAYALANRETINQRARTKPRAMRRPEPYVPPTTIHPRIKPCAICGVEYEPDVDHRARSQTCSPDCLCELKRRNGQGRSPSLDAEKIRAIRAALAYGVKPKVISEQFGISRPTITNIKKRKTWGHVA